MSWTHCLKPTLRDLSRKLNCFGLDHACYGHGCRWRQSARDESRRRRKWISLMTPLPNRPAAGNRVVKGITISALKARERRSIRVRDVQTMDSTTLSFSLHNLAHDSTFTISTRCSFAELEFVYINVELSGFPTGKKKEAQSSAKNTRGSILVS